MGFALGLIGNAEVRLAGIAGLEGGEYLLEEGLVLLRSPYGQLHGFIGGPGGLRLRRLLLAAGGSEQQDPDGQAQSSHFLFHSVKPFLKNSDGIIAPFGGVDNWQKGWGTEINFEHKHL